MSEKMTVEKVAEDVIATIMFGYADAAVSDDFYSEWGDGGEEESREVILSQYDVDVPEEKVIGKYRVTVNVEEVSLDD